MRPDELDGICKEISDELDVYIVEKFLKSIKIAIEREQHTELTNRQLFVQNNTQDTYIALANITSGVMLLPIA